MYAVRSRQDAGAQWRSKAGGRENAGTVVPRVSPTGRQGQAMEDVRIRYSTGPREGAGVVQRMAEEQERTEQGGQQEERKGMYRAVLGRRVEPYRKDVEGFKEILDSKGNDAGQRNIVNKCIVNMVRKKNQGKNNSSNNNQGDIVEISGTNYVYVIMSGEYQNSVNVWVKRKIYENYVKSENTSGNQQAKDPDEYTGRVLDVNAWSIEKNRRWIRTGSAEERMADDGGRVHLPGTEGKGQFRLVGLESLVKDKGGVFKIEKETYAYSKVNRSHQSDKQGQRVIRFMKLKKENFHKNDKINLYQAAFTDGSAAMDDKNFIAYVVNHEETGSLLRNVQTKEKQEVSVFKAEIAPTILAQEMEQLDEAKYRFATISEGGTVKKVIALPEEAAEDIRKESTQTAPQPTPSGTP